MYFSLVALDIISMRIASGKVCLLIAPMFHVYLTDLPEVRLDPVTGANPNQCDPMTSDPSQCVVTEGQRVHFRCVASSKPAPASITWQGRGDGPDLYIESTNRTQHTDTYNCNVETGPGNHGNDPRLPLRGGTAVTVIVKCELHNYVTHSFRPVCSAETTADNYTKLNEQRAEGHPCCLWSK